MHLAKNAHKNAFPNDSPRPPEWVGLRLGVGAATTRGLVEADCAELANIIAVMIEAEAAQNLNDVIESSRARVARICMDRPIYT